MTLNQATFSMIGKTAGIRWKEFKPTLDGRLRLNVTAIIAVAMASVISQVLGITWVTRTVEHSADAQKYTLIAWLQQAESDRDKAKQDLAQAESLLANQQTYTDFLRQNPTYHVRSKKQKL